MSFLYSATEAAFKVLKFKSQLDADSTSFPALLDTLERRQKYPVPANKLAKNYDWQEEQYGGQSCYRFNAKGKKASKAVLLLFGGGGLMPPDQGDFSFAGEIADRTNREVFFPMYPLAPKARLTEMLDCILKVYQAMLSIFKSEDIAFMGSSSGAFLCLALCQNIEKQKLSLPLPQRLMLLSPGLRMPPDQAQEERMRLLEAKEVMLPLSLLHNLPPVLADEHSGWLLDSLGSSWKNLPAMDIYYGEHELFYAFAPDVELKAQTENSKVRLHINKGMMHCAHMLDFTAEGKAIRKDLYERLLS